MKYLGKITDNKDLVTKEYVDNRSGVTGVKGSGESNYRTGNVNLTAGNIGAQATLVSGTNIKTINNTSILGSGNISISGGGSDVTGVKGDAESSYRIGKVNITATDIGIQAIDVAYDDQVFGTNNVGEALDVLADGAVMGIKGSAETSYRHGNVTLTAANIGAQPTITSTTALTTGKLTPSAIDNSVFVTESVDISVSASAAGNQSATKSVTKTGYYPLGIVGTLITTAGAYSRGFYLTNRASGSCTVNARLYASSNGTKSCTVYILWLKTT